MEALKSIMEIFISSIWGTIKDIIGIAPKICFDIIMLEADHVPSVEHQQRLNLPIQE